jgi:hypothetical protein
MATTARLFTLSSSGTGDLSVTAGSSSSVTLTGLTDSEDSIRIACTVDCYVRMTTGASTAVVGDILVFAGAPESFSLVPGHNTLSARPLSASGIVNWSVSKGM